MHKALNNIRWFTARAVLASICGGFFVVVMLIEESDITAIKEAIATALWR